MYNSLKRIAKLIVPKQVLKKNEFFFRRLISLKYKGNKHQCNICEFKLNRFITLESKDLLCPNCGSRSRTRRLYRTLNDNKVLKGNVLHFSPPKALYNKLKPLNINYFSSDFENEFSADYSYDITSIPVENDFFDVIICYHVLEHIEDDKKAMSELYRVLKPNGSCYIQTPYKNGDIYEDISVTSPEKRKELFGQEDHVRIYSVEGLKERLKNTGFKTQLKRFEDELYCGLKVETIVIAKK